MSVDWTIRAGDDPGVLRVLVGSALDEPRRHRLETARDRTDRRQVPRSCGPADRSSSRPERSPRSIPRSSGRSNEEPHGTAGSQASRWRWGQRSSEHSASDSIATTWFRWRNEVSSLDRPPGRDRAGPHPVERRRATRSGDRRARTGSAVGSSRPSDAANAASGLDELVERVLPVVRDAVLADGTSFLLLSDDGRELRPQGAGGEAEETSEVVAIPLGAGASGRIAAIGRPLVIGEMTSDDGISPALRGRRSLRRSARAGERPRGRGPACPSATPGAFTDDDADFLQSIADLLATTIDRTRLFDQRDRMATALERAPSRCPRRTCRASRSPRCTGHHDSVTRGRRLLRRVRRRQGLVPRDRRRVRKAPRPPPSWA